MTTAAHERRVVHYSGMVQGVGFRYTTSRVAERYVVTGFVQNLPDGRVLLIVEGVAGELDRFLSAVQAAMRDYISQTSSTTEPATGEYSQFSIRR